MQNNKHLWKTEYKVFVIGSSKNYANWIGEVVDNMDNADIVLFTGGEDVDPVLYKENQHPRTHSNPTRDADEVIAFFKAKAANKKLVGICRGSQFLCVMAGGKLVQHQENPLYIHNTISYDNDDIFEITSTHHQAQYPYNLPSNEYKLLAWTKGISPIHQNGNQQELTMPLNRECEIVYYDKINALAIQGHPEMMWGNPKYDKTFEVLKNKMLYRFMNNIYHITSKRTTEYNIEAE